MTQVRGQCQNRFSEVRHLINEALSSGRELGCSLTVNIAGENVIDLWGGYADVARTRPWEMNTIVNIFSSTKTVTSLAVLKLVDRGALSLDKPVSEYWPEFGCKGKQDITLRQIMAHTSGVSGWDSEQTISDLYDTERAVARIADQAPYWVPGTCSGYHSWTFGFLLGEIVRRVTGGQTLKDLIAEVITGPLDNADFQLGACEDDWPRIAELVSPPPPPLGPSAPATAAFDASSLFAKSMNPRMRTEFTTTPEWIRAELGGSNGHSNARAMVSILSQIAAAGGGYRDDDDDDDDDDDGKGSGFLLSANTVGEIFREQSRGRDLVNGEMLRFGAGYGLRGDGDMDCDAWLPQGKRICYWGGYGGSMNVMDLDRGITVTYVLNKLCTGPPPSATFKEYLGAIYKALE